MDVFIPIHYACHTMASEGDRTHCPVLCDLPDSNPLDESYLHLDTDAHSIDFDLQVGAQGGIICAEPAFHHAKRLYDDTTLIKAEEYSNRGHDIAQSLYFGSAYEYVAAWVNETRKQASLILDIDMVLSLNILKKTPQWMRHDLFLALESESMKQVFATRMFEQKDNTLHIPSALRQAMDKNARNYVHPAIESLMAQINKTPPSHDGAAQSFAGEFDVFLAEFQSI